MTAFGDFLVVRGFFAAVAFFAFAAFFGTLDKTHFDVELLPYHEYGKDKWASLGLTYTVHDAFVTADTVRHFVRTFTEHGIRVIST